MKVSEKCSCGRELPFIHQTVTLNPHANKGRWGRNERFHKQYAGYYYCPECDVYWVTVTMKKFRRSHVIGQ